MFCTVLGSLPSRKRSANVQLSAISLPRDEGNRKTVRWIFPTPGYRPAMYDGSLARRISGALERDSGVSGRDPRKSPLAVGILQDFGQLAVYSDARGR